MAPHRALRLRAFEAADHGPALALWRRTPGVGLSAADEAAPIAAYLARNPGTSFVAEVDGRLVGTVLCGHDGRRGLIHHLVTDPGCRRQGVARALVRAALDALRDAGIGKCHLMVFGHNGEGRRFWQAVGAVERTELGLFSMDTRTP